MEDVIVMVVSLVLLMKILKSRERVKDPIFIVILGFCVCWGACFAPYHVAVIVDVKN